MLPALPIIPQPRIGGPAYEPAQDGPQYRDATLPYVKNSQRVCTIDRFPCVNDVDHARADYTADDCPNGNGEHIVGIQLVEGRPTTD